MRPLWRYLPLATDEIQDAPLAKIDTTLRKLNDYLDSVDKALRFGSVPGAYSFVRLFLSQAGMPASTSFADMVHLDAPRRILSVAWTIRGSGSISADIRLANSTGAILGFTTVSGSGTNVGLITTGFSQSVVGNPSDPVVWLDLNNVTGTVDFVAAMIDFREAGKVETG